MDLFGNKEEDKERRKPSEKQMKSKDGKMAGYQHPKVFVDLLKSMKFYYTKHPHLPKLVRVTLGEDVLRGMSHCLQLIVILNYYKKVEGKRERLSLYLLELQGRIEVIKGLLLILWEMKFISSGFYAEMFRQMEEVSKQVSGWGRWLLEEKGID